MDSPGNQQKNLNIEYKIKNYAIKCLTSWNKLCYSSLKITGAKKYVSALSTITILFVSTVVIYDNWRRIAVFNIERLFEKGIYLWGKCPFLFGEIIRRILLNGRQPVLKIGAGSNLIQTWAFDSSILRHIRRADRTRQGMWLEATSQVKACAGSNPVLSVIDSRGDFPAGDCKSSVR